MKFKDIMWMLAALLATGVLFAASTIHAHAAKMDGAPVDTSCDGLRIASGPTGKGYSKMYRDMARIAPDLKLCEKVTTGGLDNLTALSEKQADLGIVQVDTIKAMSAGDENIAALQRVATLNSNYLHIVTSATGFNVQGEKKFGIIAGDVTNVRITAFSQLRGQPVALIGSAQLLGRQLDKQLGYGMRFVDVKDDKTAFNMIRQGQVRAAFSVSGWPSGEIKALDQSSGLTLVPFDAPIGNPYNVKPFNYKNIGVYNVPALAVQNVLVVRDFKGMKAQDVVRLKNAIAANLTELKDGDYEPGWNEIKNLDAPVADLPNFNSGGPVKAKK